jgi:hypothetical protein
MTTITGFGVLPPFLSRSSSQTAATDAVLQSLDASGAPGAGNAATAQSAAPARVPTGFSAVPQLSADVIGALIASQAEQTAGGTSDSGASGQASNSSGGSATTTSANSSSGSPTLQQIARQFDLHNITYQQEGQLESELVSAGALTQQEGQHFSALNDISQLLKVEHFELIDGKVVATTPSPSGLIDLNTQDTPPDDLTQRFQNQLAEDPSLGDSTQTAEDQNILNVLNQLQSL